MANFDVTLCHGLATECHCHLGPRKVKLALLACTYEVAENSHVLSLSRVIACSKKMVVRITFSNIYDPYKQYCEDISIFFEDSSLSKIMIHAQG
jgi:hypothetical protein